MNFSIFGLTGYISMAIAVLVPIFWFLHWMKRPRRWMVHISLFIALAAFICAKHNSLYYVNLIEEDRSEQMAAIAKKEELRQKKLEASRSEDVAKVRFAEDGGSDFIDVGGMDETDLRIHGLDKKSLAAKAAKKNGDPLAGLKKKKRSDTETNENSLTSSINSKEKKEGAEVEEIEAKSQPSIILKADDIRLANMIDGLNLKILRWMIYLSLAYILIDYLKRGNIYSEAYFPLPLPSSWFSTFSPVAPVNELPEKRRRSLLEEFTVITKRNESFLYFGDDKNFTKSIPERKYALLGKFGAQDYLPLHYKKLPVHEDFVFESLWFGRSSFYSDNPDEAESILLRFLHLMAERKESRARAQQNIHVIWDIKKPISKDIKKLFSIFGTDTGFSLHLT
jgi:hypothetical protein